jgi:hypothetical protein
MKQVGTEKIWRFVRYTFNGLLLLLLVWLASRHAIPGPNKPQFLAVALLLLFISSCLRCLRGSLPIKIGFAACVILCFLALERFRPPVAWDKTLVYEWLLWLAIIPFFPDRPSWWAAIWRTIRRFRGGGREYDERLKAKILASVKPAGTPQK